VPATTAKKQMLEIIEQQPDDSSYEELLRELAFEHMVERGFDDADHDRTISHEEMGKRIVGRCARHKRGHLTIAYRNRSNGRRMLPGFLFGAILHLICAIKEHRRVLA